LGRARRVANPRPLDDPLVGCVALWRQLVVRAAPCGDVPAEPRDPDARPVGRADHRSTAKVSVPRAASSFPTWAVALPRPIGPLTWSISQTSESVSPGETTRLKRQSSIPAKNAIRPRFSSSTRTATAPVWAMASTIRTPGTTARSGKCPATHQPSSGTRYAAATRWPGRTSSTSSSRRKGARWGRMDSISRRPKGGVGTTRRVYCRGPPNRRSAPEGRRVRGRVWADDDERRERLDSGDAERTRAVGAHRPARAVDTDVERRRLGDPDAGRRRRDDPNARRRRVEDERDLDGRRAHGVGDLHRRDVRPVEGGAEALASVPGDDLRARAERPLERRRDPAVFAKDPHGQAGGSRERHGERERVVATVAVRRHRR